MKHSRFQFFNFSKEKDGEHLKQKATVVSVDGKYAIVSVMRSSMCDGCHKNSCEGGCSMYKIFGADKRFEARAKNAVGASTGDKVQVEASDRSVLFSAFIVFILPIVLATAVYLISSMFVEAPNDILIATAVFFVYFGVLAVFEKFKSKKETKFVITEIIGNL